MSVSAVQNQSAATTGASTTTKAGSNEIQDRFLRLLITQLQNQDPMNPMENAELTSQLAQMSTVEGINNLNSSMSQLLDGFYSTQNLQAASLIGHQVLADGDLLSLAESQAGGGVNLASSADSVEVKILDAAGKTVRTLDLGAQDAGITHFIWDGKDATGEQLADGEYTMSVSASKGGTSVQASTLSLSTVASVTMSGGYFKVDLVGLGQRDLSSVQQIF
jgi:flagellar basal-body rod modification protein FlgD